jgi:hypothetical protein
MTNITDTAVPADPGTGLRPISIVTVTYDTFFFVRLLVEKVREFVGGRSYEIIVVDRGSRDGSRRWLQIQPDVRLFTHWQWSKTRHTHGKAAEKGVHYAKHECVVLLDSDAHPVSPAWLELTVDRLDERHRLAGAEHRERHVGNPYGSYIHPFFMTFFRVDFGQYVRLEKMRGHDTDTGEEATIRLRDAGFDILGYPIEFCPHFAVGHPNHPQISAGVFHAGHATRLVKNSPSVIRETQGLVTTDAYIEPLKQLLRQTYGLGY